MSGIISDNVGRSSGLLKPVAVADPADSGGRVSPVVSLKKMDTI